MKYAIAFGCGITAILTGADCFNALAEGLRFPALSAIVAVIAVVAGLRNARRIPKTD